MVKKLNFQGLSAKRPFKKLRQRNNIELFDRFMSYWIGFSKTESIDKVGSIIENLKILKTVKKPLKSFDLQVFFAAKQINRLSYRNWNLACVEKMFV